MRRKKTLGDKIYSILYDKIGANVEEDLNGCEYPIVYGKEEAYEKICKLLEKYGVDLNKTL